MNQENYASWRVFTVTHFETILEKRIPGAPAFISIRLVLSPLETIKKRHLTCLWQGGGDSGFAGSSIPCNRQKQRTLSSDYGKHRDSPE